MPYPNHRGQDLERQVRYIEEELEKLIYIEEELEKLIKETTDALNEIFKRLEKLERSKSCNQHATYVSSVSSFKVTEIKGKRSLTGTSTDGASFITIP